MRSQKKGYVTHYLFWIKKSNFFKNKLNFDEIEKKPQAQGSYALLFMNLGLFNENGTAKSLRLGNKIEKVERKFRCKTY